MLLRFVFVACDVQLDLGVVDRAVVFEAVQIKRDQLSIEDANQLKILIRCGPLAFPTAGAAPWSWPSPAKDGAPAHAKLKVAARASQWSFFTVFLVFMWMAP